MKRAGDAQLIGETPIMLDLKQEIDRVAQSDAKVLITGESGVGKELVAHAIHSGSARRSFPFVAVNCAGLPETLLESELFGHVKGSFTGAYRNTPGKLETADKGTVFLDEVGEMSLRMQGLLLRFLETGEIQKVGADGSNGTVNARVVTATNRNLAEMIVHGQFREDLLYRLNVIHLHVPPLRERRDDIPSLFEHFVRHLCPDGAPAPQLDGEALAALVQYTWPGNIRELQNVIERLLVKKGETIRFADLPVEIRGQGEVSLRPKRERRRTVADDLFTRIVEGRESFWSAAYPLYMHREITRGTMCDLVRKGLEQARGNYRIVTRMFNVDTNDYRKFLNFLRKHQCLLPFREYR